MANDLLERMRSGQTRREAEARKQRAKERAAERVEQGKRNREFAASERAKAEIQRAAAKPAPAPAPAPVRAKPKPVSAVEVELDPRDVAGQRQREFSRFLGRTRNAQAAQLRKGRK